jgi:predicted dehydrogenase
MSNPLRVGVIGLGSGWRSRYKTAMLALTDRFSVSAVCDEVRRRAEREARELKCSAVAGPAALLERDNIDAVLLIDQQWFGLWPVELACRSGKPVFCAVSLEADHARAEALCQRVRESRLPVQVEMTPRLAPATVRLRDLLAGELGAPQLVLCEAVQPEEGAGPAGTLSGDGGSGPVLGSHGIALLDWCASVLEGEPISAVAAGVETLHFTDAVLEFSGGRGVHLQCHSRPGRASFRLQAVTDKGSIEIELPTKICWTSPDGSYTQRLPSERSPAQRQLEQFHDAIRERKEPTPNLRDALRALGWLRAIRLSREQGRRVEIKSTSLE